MSFSNFLIERPDQTDEEFITNVAKTIIKDCQPFLKEVNYDYNLATQMYRGVKRAPSQNFSLKNVRQDRRPTDMPPAIHQYVDQWFTESFGVPFRSAGVFATGNRGMASHYGHIVLMFPIGQSKYVWSPRHADLFAEIRHRFKLTDDWGDWMWNKKELDFAQEEKLEDILDEGQYTNTNLSKALQTYTEIMVHTERYYIVRCDWQDHLARAIQKELK